MTPKIPTTPAVRVLRIAVTLALGIVLGLGAGCAAVMRSLSYDRYYEVDWADDSEDHRIWACMRDPAAPKEAKLICVDLIEVLKEGEPTFVPHSKDATEL